MKRIRLALLGALLITTNVTADEISFLTHNVEGQVYTDQAGELRGIKHSGKRAFNIEVVRELMLTMKHSTKFQEVPFARGMQMVTKNNDLAMFNVSRTPDRENMVKWVGPIQKEEDYFYEMKSAPTGISKLEDARKVSSICVLNGAIHHKILNSYHFNNIYTNVSYVGCFNMLKKGRVDLTVSASSTVLSKLKEAEISPDQIQQTPVVLLVSEGYIAFSNNIPDETVDKWQQALDRLKDSGEYEKLYQLYFLPDD
ncbi:transporter substrate-binding domain-containing protein [Hahella sp. CR1]|uniref:substrate-binding periplasmic protein n=1 Tax=Hahella sp. CR1 TaxID=2992807 RepID=UPI0024417481|nr:transporter substrate-binding domain-containing protein [Hahella sp. CR1]MDG9669534.1 transporter substrate-binding domain-containing protein [Hahella sp. CR1]